MKSFMFSAVIILLVSSYTYSDAGQFSFAPVFTDSLVLQQQADVHVWGHGTPGTTVTISASWGKTAHADVDTNGSWMATISTPGAGGPYQLTGENGDTSLVLHDVLIGEVWLCSGQSNMEMPLAGWPPNDTIANAEAEVQKADFPNIRMFYVQPAYSIDPKSSCAGSWKACTPEAARRFSAAAYYFGRKLYRDLKVPIGLIQSTWGGTPVEAWTSEQYITRTERYKDYHSTLEKARSDIAVLLPWLAALPVVNVADKPADVRYTGLYFGDSVCASTTFNDSSWHTMTIPTLWEQAEIGPFDGTVWYRKTVTIPRSWIGSSLVIELGPIDDYDRTYINGVFVGGMETGTPYNLKRVFDIPAEIVKDTVVTIAVRVVDTGGGGGLWGRKDEMKLHPKGSDESVALAGTWKFLPVAEFRDSRFYLFDIASQEFYRRPKVPLEITPYIPTTLFNGMIAPLIPYSIKGAIWYQGEANVDNPAAYDTLFPLMIDNWRTDWKSSFPFYYVQIAPFSYGPVMESQRLRESQLHALAVPNTGMAVTLDIGTARTIHPSDKTDVGERLARWALAKQYGKKIAYSGPLYKSYTIKRNSIILSFNYADGLAVKPNDGRTYFQIAGRDSLFHDAKVVVKGKTIIVSSPEVTKPIAVRYGWDNVVKGTLFNKAGLPASSFRTDTWNR